MESKIYKITKLVLAASCLSTVPAGLAQNYQTKPAPENHAEYAAANPSDDGGNGAAAADTAPAPAAEPAAERKEVAPSATVSGADIRPALAKELEAMKLCISELEAELAASGATATDAAKALQGAKDNFVEAPACQPASPAAAPAQPSPAVATPDLPAEVTTKSAPFAYADWTWLNGNPRTKDTPMATKYFTPEFRADVNYILDFNHPKDDTMGGSTESFRSDEVQVEQL